MKDLAEIVAWLTQICDEDAAIVQAAIDDDCGQDGGFEDSFDLLTKGPDVAGPLAFTPRFGEPAAAMIVRNTPRRALAQIEADRQVIATCLLYADSEWHRGYTCGAEGGYITILMQMATRRADRPGYQEEWRP